MVTTLQNGGETTSNHNSQKAPLPVPPGGKARAKQTCSGKSDRIKQATEKALGDLLEALKAGKSEALVAHLKMMGRFHTYSLTNCMLIASQFPEATRVAGFKAWRKMGRFVRKGERGIMIIAPMLRKAREGENPDADRNDGRKMIGYRAVHVFDISQTEGEELEKLARVQGEPGDCIDRLAAFCDAQGLAVEYVERAELGGAEGVSKGGLIQIADDHEPAERFGVLAHEIAHELMHKAEDRKALSKTVKETEAEAVAFVVSSAVGLDHRGAASDYIQLYQGDAETLMASLERIQSAASKILEALELNNN